MNDVMQGHWTLLHVIRLVVWQKRVKSLSLSQGLRRKLQDETLALLCATKYWSKHAKTITGTELRLVFAVLIITKKTMFSLK